MRAAAFIVLAACATPSDSIVTIERVTPEYGPLAGGTRVVITGRWFFDHDAGPTRVLVAGKEAPLANPLDDATVEVVIPPGDKPGDAEIILLNRNGNAIGNNVFHYSEPPAITSIAPAEIVYSTLSTTMTLSGTGFVDEAAGEPIVLVDGVAVMDVQVLDDTTLTFSAPGGRALGRPRVEVGNARGLATKERGFKYRPSSRSGLLLFPQFGSTFAMFFDPVANTTVSIPRTGNSFGYTTVIVDDHNEYWAFDRGSQVGRIDLSSQRLEQAIQLNSIRIPAMARIGNEQFGFDRYTRQFGSIGLDGQFRPIGNTTFGCCGSWGVAYDGTTLYFTQRSGADRTINTIDPATGATGTPVTLVGAPGFSVEEMRFFDGVLYATSKDGTIVKIDPVTGQTSFVLSLAGGRVNAMEVFE